MGAETKPKIEINNKAELPTAVLRDWGILAYGKIVLYLENLSLMEKSRIFIPQPPQSAKTLAASAPQNRRIQEYNAIFKTKK